MRKVLCALVVAAALGGALAATSLSASAGTDRHLEFLLRSFSEDRIDADGDSTLSVGDTYVAQDDVLDPAEQHTVVGRLAIDCVVIALPSEEDKTELSRCNGALLQDGGKLLVSTVTTGAELDSRRIDLAVVGGTGRYRGATGDAVNDLSSGESRLIVSLD